MTTPHLSPDEVLAAVEGELTAARSAHIETCAECRDAVASARSILQEVAAARVPEPSPLFWDHFSARVRAATLADAPAASPRWSVSWRSWALMATALGAVVLAVTLRSPSLTMPPTAAVPSARTEELPGAEPRPNSTAAAGAQPAAASTARSATLNQESGIEVLPDVEQMAAALSRDDVGALLPGGETSLLVEELSARERAAFVRLVTAEMEKAQ